MTANLRVEQIAEMQFAFPTFTEAVGMAAQAIVRELGIAPLPPSWSDLHPPEAPVPGGGYTPEQPRP
jgi:hypothetical protein